MWEALAIIGAAIIGYLGNEESNETNVQQAQANRDFQDQQSSTAYQRSVADLRAAGLNPMLAYQRGGAQSGPGSVGQVTNSAGAAMSSAGSAAGLMSGVEDAKLKREQQDQQKAQTDLIRAQAEKTRSETMEHQVNSAIRAEELKNLRLTGLEKDAVIPGLRFDSMTKQGAFEAQSEKQKPGDMSGFEADVRRRKAEARSAEMGLAEASAQEKFYRSDMGIANPQIRQIFEILRGVSSARRGSR